LLEFILSLASNTRAAGAIGFAYHIGDFKTQQSFPYGIVGVELVRVVAILCGFYMLRGHDWARWTALAWMAFHVVVSAFHTPTEFVLHAVFCAAIAWVLFRQQATHYFRAPENS
jgi:hypothetical protein